MSNSEPSVIVLQGMPCMGGIIHKLRPGPCSTLHESSPVSSSPVSTSTAPPISVEPFVSQDLDTNRLKVESSAQTLLNFSFHDDLCEVGNCRSALCNSDVTMLPCFVDRGWDDAAAI